MDKSGVLHPERRYVTILLLFEIKISKKNKIIWRRYSNENSLN